LLLKEVDEEIPLLISWVSEVVSELLLNLICRHERWREGVHESLGVFSIFSVNDKAKHVEVLLEVWLNELELLISSEETVQFNLNALEVLCVV
jgi:hypothetical protein